MNVEWWTCPHGARKRECEKCNAAMLTVWFGPGRDHDYGEKMTYGEFIGLSRGISVADMKRVAFLKPGEMMHGKDEDDDEPFTVRKDS
jgi:hypothetical protein